MRHWSWVFLGVLLAATVEAQTAKALSDLYATVSPLYSAPDDDKHHFQDLNFRFAWSDKAPYTLAIQFTNNGYKNLKYKFAVKDATTQKTVMLDAANNSNFGQETLNANSQGPIWSGALDNPKDDLVLVMWDSDGDEFDKDTISLKDLQ